MNAYDHTVVTDAKLSQQLIEVLECLDEKKKATWDVLKLQELINEKRGLGNSISIESMMKIVQECFTAYQALPEYPLISYVEKIRRTILLVEEYTVKLLGA
jgi:hypothetical protein